MAGNNIHSIVVTELPSIERSISRHQFSSLKFALQALGCERAGLERVDVLTGLYNQLVPVRPDDCAAVLYQMLVHVGCPEGDGLCKISTLVDQNVILEFRPALILKFAFMLERMDERTFQQFSDSVRGDLFPGYHSDQFSSKTDVLQHFIDENKLQVQHLCTSLGKCGCEIFVTELETLCAKHEESFPKSVYISPMDPENQGQDIPPKCSRKRIGCLITGVLIFFTMLSSSAVVIGVFAHFLDNPSSSDGSSHVLYAPRLDGVNITSLIGCYSSLTKEIIVTTDSDDFDVLLYEVKEKDLQIDTVPLPSKLLATYSTKFGHILDGINYYRGSNPFYTASNATLVYEVQLSTNPGVDVPCQFRLLVFNNYADYNQFRNSRGYKSYRQTECLTGTGNFTIPFGLQGDAYYFVGVEYNGNPDFGVSAYATNTSQYAVSEYSHQCSLSVNQRQCELPAVSFPDSLNINGERVCLVAQASRSITGGNFNVTIHRVAQSHIRAVYSGGTMIGVLSLNLLVILVIIILVIIIRKKC